MKPQPNSLVIRLSMEKLMRETAHIIVTTIACLRKKANVLIICGLHNKVFAEHIKLESYVTGAYPYLWVFDENFFFLKCSKIVPENVIAVLPEHTQSLLEKANVIIWLSQFENLERFPLDFRRAISSFWDAVYEVMKTKPRLLVNLPSTKYIEGMDIDYEEFLSTFMKAVRVNYKRVRKIGSNVASKLEGKRSIHVYSPNGTDLVFSIADRPVSVEVGTLENCFYVGRECEVEVPAGEVYVAPIETSANGILVVDELRNHCLKELKLHFEKGKIVSFKAKKGSDQFRNMLEEAEGDKDRIGELGIGTNYSMKPIGWNVYDEKALGTAHIAIGNNIQCGGVNKASIHVDFILQNPTIKADDKLIMETGRLVR